jgi:hypothetical protein
MRAGRVCKRMAVFLWMTEQGGWKSRMFPFDVQFF